MIAEMTNIAKNICLVLGNDKIKKMSYSDQLKCMTEGLENLFKDYDTEIKFKAYILTLFQEQIKKKYPKLSKKQSWDLAKKLFTEHKVSTKKNEDIKKYVLEKARKFFAKTLVKVAEKSKSTKDELHISHKNSQHYTETREQGNAVFVIVVLVVVFLLILLFAK